MALQLILGNSGSGKTEYLYHRIVEEAEAHPDGQYLVLVPEQFTLQTQRELVEKASHKAIMNIDVVSFQRLAYRIFDELGIQQVQVLDETAKNLVLRKLAADQEDSLDILKGQMHRTGYISEVKSLLSELSQYSICAADLRDLIAGGKLSPILEKKLGDVATLYEAYENFMQGRYTTNEELLNLLCQVAADSKILRGAVLAFDDYTGFTPIQNNLLQVLFPIVSQVYVTVTIDGREDFYKSMGMEELFDLPKKTIASLLRIARETKTPVEEPVILQDVSKRRFCHSEELLHLEQNLFRRNASAYEKKTRDLSVYIAHNPVEELEEACRCIQKLVQDNGYHYREFAIVSGDAATYGRYAGDVFKRYRIPFFLDQTTNLLLHPFTEAVRALLQIVEEDFSREAVFRFLRTGFTELTDSEIDLLENYILATGIRGEKNWKAPFKRQARDLIYPMEVIEKQRRLVYSLLSPLLAVFHDPKAKVSDWIGAIYRLLVTLQVEKQLADKAKAYGEAGDGVRSSEYKQIYKIVIQLFEKCMLLLGDEQITLEEFIDVIEAGLDAAKVSVIPYGQDYVTIGDIERTRLNHIKVLFFVGVNDGLIPKNAERGGIISSMEREYLKELEVELAPGAREENFRQRYYLYLNLTKTSEQLYVSYHMTDSEGKASRPSYLIATLKRLYPQLSLRMVEEERKLEELTNEEVAFHYLMTAKRDDLWYSLVSYFLSQPQWRERTENLLTAADLHYEEDPITRVVASAIYGDKLYVNVSRLERFARCAYSHFLQYGVGLREREEMAFRDNVMGDIYHEALDQYMHLLEASDQDWYSIDSDNRNQLAAQAFEQALLQLSVAGYEESHKLQETVEYMKRVFERTVWALTLQVRQGRFVPRYAEYKIGDLEDSDTVFWQTEDGASIRLNGRVDRIDTCVEGEETWVKIIDYKSGFSSFSDEKLYYGLQLQLPTYLNAAIAMEEKKHPGQKVLPAGLLYYHIDDPQIEYRLENDVAMDEESYRNKILDALRPKGKLNSDRRILEAMDQDLTQASSNSHAISMRVSKDNNLNATDLRNNTYTREEFDIVREYTRNKTREIAEDILAGRVSVNPTCSGSGNYATSSCDYCSYGAICGIRSRLPGYQVEERKNTKDYLDRMNTENALRRHKETT